MELLERLCKAHAVSGFEDDVADIMEKELREVCDEVTKDSFGNVIGVKGKGQPKIMLAAHMDEIGLMIKHITKEGYLRFVKIGGIDTRILLNQRVVIKTKKGMLTGVIGAKPPHLQREEDKKKVAKHEDMFIDIGAKDKKEAEGKVEIGDPVVFEPNYGRLNDQLYYGKAVDNRIACYALIRIMQSLPKKLAKTVYAVGSAQEEVGLKGARVAAFKLNPDYALAIDTTLAGDTPEIKESESSLKLGKGPAITITEASGRGVITHQKIKDLLNKVAKKKKIPIQVDVLEGGMTDAAVIYLTREGIPSGVVSIPTRYIHGPSGVFHMKDVENAIKLTIEALNEI